MDSFDQTTRFRYNPNANNGSDTDFSGILEIYVHHARNIHNICIYDNQDVYAKFSLTYNPDQTFSTRIINGGGKNPEFNEHLVIKVNQFDSVVKCEMWMLSRAKNFLEDQLLGFALVPISLVAGKGKITQDFSLSSTDLFHSPAGTVKLSLCLNTNFPLNHPCLSSVVDSEAAAVMFDRKVSVTPSETACLDPAAEYSRVEFPDISVVRENQLMVSEYFGLTGCRGSSRLGSFLRLGACSDQQGMDDYEMAANSSDENRGGSVSPNGSIQNSGFFSSTMTSLSDDRNSLDSMEKKNHLSAGDRLSNSPNALMTADDDNIQGLIGGDPDTPTSNDVRDHDQQKEQSFSGKEDEVSSIGKAFSSAAPLGGMNHEAEQSSMQQQIVDMYMRSMHQFTESLAKMKLPMDIDKPDQVEDRVIQHPKKKLDVENKKKEGSRVFYGSRAFF